MGGYFGQALIVVGLAALLFPRVRRWLKTGFGAVIVLFFLVAIAVLLSVELRG